MTASRHHSGASPGPVCTSAPVLKGAGAVAVASPVLGAVAVGVESIRVIELSVLTYVVLGFSGDLPVVVTRLAERGVADPPSSVSACGAVPTRGRRTPAARCVDFRAPVS